MYVNPKKALEIKLDRLKRVQEVRDIKRQWGQVKRPHEERTLLAQNYLKLQEEYWSELLNKKISSVTKQRSVGTQSEMPSLLTAQSPTRSRSPPKNTRAQRMHKYYRNRVQTHFKPTPSLNTQLELLSQHPSFQPKPLSKYRRIHLQELVGQ